MFNVGDILISDVPDSVWRPYKVKVISINGALRVKLLHQLVTKGGAGSSYYTAGHEYDVNIDAYKYLKKDVVKRKEHLPTWF